MLKHLFLIAIPFLFIPFNLLSQDRSGVWQLESKTDKSVINKTSHSESAVHSDVYELNFILLKNRLAGVPERSNNKNLSNVSIQFPVGNGKTQEFRIVEVSNMAIELQNKYSNIRSYVGIGINNNNRIRFSVSPFGLQGIIKNVNGENYVIEPLNRNENKYVIFNYKDFVQEPIICGVNELNSKISEYTKGETTFNKYADDSTLRTYRLAITATAEFSQFILDEYGIDAGATINEKKTAVLSEMNNILTFLNGIFEIDLATRLLLVANNEDIIFLNTATDGLTHNNRILLFSENQTVQDAVILSENYDIGHVMDHANFGGIGELTALCNPVNKAKGVTGFNALNLSNYLLFTHEIGHQFGANHVFNNCSGSIPSTSGGPAVEAGSGSTIMGYPGNCTAGNNIQSFRDMYFNAYNLGEMWTTINSTGTCATLIGISNASPVISPLADYTIPILTPYYLEAIATDANADNLSYTWEQQDAEIVSIPLVSTNTEGPGFRSLPPANTNIRFFPAMETTLLGNTGNTWEVLPSVARTMTFVATVRDNNILGGQTTADELVVTFNDTAGPFVVTNPSVFEIWAVGEEITISWDVANTNAAPVSCATVNILLSTDGGNSYPIVLASDTANDGSHSITVPNNLTLNGRIKIEASDNIFFDVSTEIEISIDGLPTKTSIPDPSFETALRYLGFDNDGGTNNGTVYKRDIADVTELTIGDIDLPFGYNTITDLTGIEDFENLVYLGCFKNQISTLDLSQNQSLVILYCNDNNLTDLDLSQNSALTNLNCFRNDLVSLNVKNGNNSNMTQFDARLNSISCIEVDDSVNANAGTGAYASWLKDTESWYSESCATSTFIPDTNFEQYLIDNSIDSDGIINKNVFNDDISGITTLSIPNLGIADLTGIQGFTSLTVLSAENNLLTTIDVSNNVSLQSLILNTNSLTNIDLSNNPDLSELNLSDNQLTALDLSNNLNVQFVLLANNAIEALDLSLNDQILFVECNNNDLSIFNIKNGTNDSILLFDVTANPNLFCIQVDDSSYSTTNWTSKDSQTEYNHVACYARLLSKVFIQGPYDTNTGLMTDALRSGGLLPTTSAYTDALTIEPSVLTVPGNDAIVDWIWVEIRDAADGTTIINSRSALIQADGDVVDINGTSPLVFDGAIDYYFITLSHRNHLGVITAGTFNLKEGVVDLDLRSDSNLVTGGTNAIKDMGDGNFALYGGDFDGNGQVQNSDLNGMLPLLGISSYSFADLDMNGQVQNTDINMLLPNLGLGSQSGRYSGNEQPRIIIIAPRRD